MINDKIIAGILFDFMGWLTSRDERLTLSSVDDSAPAADAVVEFCDMRGISLDEAAVLNWNELRIEQPDQMPEIDRAIRMLNYVEDFASKGGWTKESCEGAFDFVQRVSYEQGYKNAPKCNVSPEIKRWQGFTDAEGADIESFGDDRHACGWKDGAFWAEMILRRKNT